MPFSLFLMGLGRVFCGPAGRGWGRSGGTRHSSGGRGGDSDGAFDGKQVRTIEVLDRWRNN